MSSAKNNAIFIMVITSFALLIVTGIVTQGIRIYRSGKDYSGRISAASNSKSSCRIDYSYPAKAAALIEGSWTLGLSYKSNECSALVGQTIAVRTLGIPHDKYERQLLMPPLGNPRREVFLECVGWAVALALWLAFLRETIKIFRETQHKLSEET